MNQAMAQPVSGDIIDTDDLERELDDLLSAQAEPRPGAVPLDEDGKLVNKYNVYCFCCRYLFCSCLRSPGKTTQICAVCTCHIHLLIICCLISEIFNLPTVPLHEPGQSPVGASKMSQPRRVQVNN